MEKKEKMEEESSKKNSDDQTKHSRKPRKRMKATFAKIRDQMEFYFGDANLHKDRFMKKTIEGTSDGYVDLDIFLKFNKIAALTDDVKVIADSLVYKSTILEVNEDKTKVRRTTPIMEPQNVDERTVYVECLPNSIDHEWVKKLFSACGKVTYVSLPRYPSSRDLKGFAFVEFETAEGAMAACKELNNPPVDLAQDKIGMFPKSSHQLEAIKKKIPEDQIKETEERVKVIITKENVEDESSEIKETKEETDTDNTDQLLAPGKRQRTVSENSADCPTPTKRKRSDNQSETNQSSDIDKPSGKKKSRKRKSRSKTLDSNLLDSDVVKSDSELDKSAEAGPEKKRKLDDNVAKVEQATDETGILKANDKENTLKKKKQRLRKKKLKREKEVPELRVIPKKEWLKLREEYLQLQKTNMKLLKKTLNEKTVEENQVKEDKKKRKEIQFKPDVIVKVASTETITRKKLKESFKEDIQVAYIDITDGLTEGFIRCENPESASELLKTSLDAVNFTLLSGEEEKQYWNKLTLDRETKLNTKCRAKKRGHQKLMDKAQKVTLDTTERKHIVFDDE